MSETDEIPSADQQVNCNEIEEVTAIEEEPDNTDKSSNPDLTVVSNSLLHSITVHDFGEDDPQAPFVISLYITSWKGQNETDFQVAPLAQALENILSGRVRIQKTRCGLMVAYTKHLDAETTLKLPLKKIFRSPIEVVKFPMGEVGYRRSVLVHNVPWCISNLEILQALKVQGIKPNKIARIGVYLEIELSNATDHFRLVQEGLNFFDRVNFNVINEASDSPHITEPDILQCYRCQGFWHTSNHCREVQRCVRCGDNHCLEFCTRSRNNPSCCHCRGPHHAASKDCPVRQKLIHSSQVAFTISRNKPSRGFSHSF